MVQGEKPSHTILAKELADRPTEVWSHAVRIITEIAPDKRPLFEAQAIWIGTMAQFGLERDLFDIKWLTYSLSVSVKGAPAGQSAALCSKH